MNYEPPFTISPKTIKLISVISEYTGRIDLDDLTHSPQLRKQNRIKTITGTLAIEGNTLNLEQVTAIVEGKRVLGQQREIAEVLGAIKAYESLSTWQSFNKRDLLEAHQMMMSGVMKSAGRFRQTAVGIHKGKKVIHIAPGADRAPQLMADLLLWCKTSEHHPLIVSCVFHYEFEFIHPFSDGNGRIGRLWQTLILGQWKPLFYLLPLESVIKEQQTQYYEALAKADNAANSTVFIEFMLEAIQAVLRQSDPVTVQVSDQVKKLLAVLKNKCMSREALMSELGLSHKATFRKNYLHPALEQGLIMMTDPNTPQSPKQKYKRV